MNRLAPFLEDVTARIALHSAAIGTRVVIDPWRALDRSDATDLQPPSHISANGACRLLRTADRSWVAVNMPRETDRDAAPALVQREQRGELWEFLAAECARLTARELRAQAQLLGIALAEVGEAVGHVASNTVANGARASRRSSLSVVDLASLWAGPLCGSIFEAMSADVCKIESVERPDTTALSASALDVRLNGGKTRRRLSFRSADDLAALREEIASCDVLITNARARALDALGLSRDALQSANPSMVWVAITGHGWASDRVAFGDDAAAAGGLVDWRDGAPRFIGDALADPLTGLAAAAAALELVAARRGGFIDAALAPIAAQAAQRSRRAA